MERSARARFLVVRVNRWSLAMLIIAVLALLMWPSRKLLATTGEMSWRVPQGVFLLGTDFSGKSEREAKQLLNMLAAAHRMEPQPARELSTSTGVRYVTTEVDGYELDVALTWNRLATAEPGTEVQPVTRSKAPEKRLTDFPNQVIRTGNSARPAVAMLINVDVGWGKKELPIMLETLKNRGAKVTFFVSGRWAVENGDLLKAIDGAGHEIATHGYNLAYGPFDLARAGKLKDDIHRSVTTIEGITKTKVQYYAPHKSEVDERVLQTAADLRLRTVLYSIDTVDWMKQTTPDHILQKFQVAKAGDLILMHPKPNTALALDGALQILQAKNLQALTLTDVLSPEPPVPSGKANP